MKLGLRIAAMLRDVGIRHVFVVSGGCSLHLIHAISETEGIGYVCPQHEQAAGFAADAYARFTGLGCALSTSGPGATNLITSIATSYYDSVPVLYLTGQVASSQMRPELKVRQYGFQETPIVEMVKMITKYAARPEKPTDVLQTLETAIWMTRQGRPGPVLVDIHDDFQRAEA